MRTFPRIAAALVAVMALATACTASSSASRSPSVSTTPTVAVVTTPPATTAPRTTAPKPFVPKAFTTLPASPDQTARTGEKAADCPYVATRKAWDLEGNRMGLTTTFGASPVGCRFYFLYADHHVVLEIAPTRFTSNVLAHNAMVLTAEKGTEAAIPRSAGGLDAVVFRTKFYGPDGASDWACAFTKGTTMVVIRTDQTNTSEDAVNVAKAIVSHF